MNLERQAQILLERHGLVLYDYFDEEMAPKQRILEVSGPPAFVDGVGTSAFRAWANGDDEANIQVIVWFPRRRVLSTYRTLRFSNFVAAVTYAKAELARLAAAEENR